LTTLHSFDGTDGGGSEQVLVQGANGNFYGTSSTVFEITTSGTFTVLYTFSGGTGNNNLNPADPLNALIQGTSTDGNFYAITLEGGSGSNCGTDGCGTLFKMTPSGTLTVLYSFLGQPTPGLVQGTNGVFYGETNSLEGGDYGSIYSLSVGLGPFVETQTASGAVGAAVNILGTDLTGATSVTFNGTAAKFTVASSSEITTTVPSGATTGEIKVVTPSGTLSSNVSFMVP
jgi:hypothetical protein